VRTREYNKTKTTILYSKHKILEIPDLFQLSVAKFMYSFQNGGLPNHFDSYFAEIASVHKYQTRLVSLQKYYLPRMKTTLGHLSLKYIGLTFQKNWNHLRLVQLAKNIKKSCYLARLPVELRFICLSHSVWSSFYILVPFSNIPLMPLFSLLSASIIAHPTPVHRHAFPHCFLLLILCLFHLTLIWRILLLLLVLVKRLQLKFGLC